MINNSCWIICSAWSLSLYLFDSSINCLYEVLFESLSRSSSSVGRFSREIDSVVDEWMREMQRERIVERSLFLADETSSSNVFAGGSSNDFKKACWAAAES